VVPLRAHLDYTKLPPPRIQEDYAEGPMVVPGGGAVSYERGTPVKGLSAPCRALSGRLESTVRRHKFNGDSLYP